jgi:hypothetical protein
LFILILVSVFYPQDKTEKPIPYLSINPQRYPKTLNADQHVLYRIANSHLIDDISSFLDTAGRKLLGIFISTYKSKK